MKKDLLNFYHCWKLKKWVDPDKLDYERLSDNPRAMYLLEENPTKIAWAPLCRNPSAIYWIEKHKDSVKFCITLRMFISGNESAYYFLWKNKEYIDWKCLSQNPSWWVVDYLTKNPDRICWPYLSRNPSAIHLIEENLDEVCWTNLSRNPAAIHLLRQNMEKIEWYLLVENELAIPIFEENPHQLDDASDAGASFRTSGARKDDNWDELLTNPSIIHLLKDNFDPTFTGEVREIDWTLLSENPSAIHILEKNQDKINWRFLSSNQEIFELDYDFFHQRMNIIREELIEKTWHPDRFEKWCLPTCS